MAIKDYADRKDLYKMYEHSQDVTTTVGIPESGWTTREEGDIPTYGVELEVATDYEPKHIIDAFPEIFAICKKDSTISGNKKNKIEIVTIPATLRKQRRNWAAFFKNLNEDMFDTLDKHTNGLHIHVGRSAFDKDLVHQKKFCYFFTNPGMADFLVEISERDKESLNSYSKLSTARNLAQAERTLQSQSKYSVVNMGKSATLEVRLFKGIVSAASVIKNLEFVDSVVEFTRLMPIYKITFANYLKYIDALPKTKYRTLRWCLEEMNLKDMLALASVRDAIAQKGAVATVALLNNGMLSVPETLIDAVVAHFDLKFVANGMSLKFTGGTWVIVREGTRFAKFNDKVMSMYRDRPVRNAA